jgi:peptide deformylase
MNAPSANIGSESNLRPRGEGSFLNPRVSLVLYPDQILRTVCQPVEIFDSALRDLAEEMLLLMRCHEGIGLAAPQVGLRQRLMVSCVEEQSLVLANLEVMDSSRPRDSIEGCLSLPGVQVAVRRPERIRVIGYDVRGRRRSFGAVGLWARVIQHELDHLNGVLICDYKHPGVEQCEHCPLELPAELIEQRKHRSHPNPRR